MSYGSYLTRPCRGLCGTGSSCGYAGVTYVTAAGTAVGANAGERGMVPPTGTGAVAGSGVEPHL